MRPHNIELHIEELVLHGFAPKDRYAIGESIQRELARLFAEQGMPQSLGRGYEAARLDGGSFHMAEESKGDAIGVQVAQSVYGGLGR